MNIRQISAKYLLMPVIFLMIVFLPTSPVRASNQVFDLVSLANDGTLPESFYNGDRSKITPDGRYVVYRSAEPKLVTPNTSGNQIFLRDRTLGTTELISISNQNQYGNNSSDWATISNDGCRVVFQSYASNLVTNDTNGAPDIFLRDRCQYPATTTRVNLNYNGAESPAASYTPYLSGNGRYVAFNSYSTDLVIGVTRSDLLYLRDLDLQTTILLSESIVDGLGEQAWNPAVSDDGNRIAFYSASSELVASVLPASKNVFLYDMNTNPHIRLVSSDANGNPQDFADGNGPYPGISADGHYVSFYSNAHNLVPNDTNLKYDIFVKNVDTNEIWRANVSSSGQQANEDTQFNSTLSEDGTWVSFWALASNLASNSQSISRVILLHNIWTGETRPIPGTNSEDVPKISGDLYGRFISNYWGDKLDTNHPSAGVFVYDRHRLPVAIAKIDTSTHQPANPGDSITLDGSSSNNNANVNNTTNFFAPKAVPALAYTWTQTAGNAITFNDPHAVKPSFTAPTVGSYTFKLVVNDTIEVSIPSQVTIEVASLIPLPQILNGTNSNDKLTGNDGDDILNGGKGADKLTGGLGNDIYYVDNINDLVTENANEGTDVVNSVITYTLLVNLENLILNGKTAINGTGNSLNNLLTGNAGANKLSGLAGNDTLIGGLGKDILTGGSGKDLFIFNAIAEIGKGAGRDLITDFSNKQGDKINLANIDANTKIKGKQGFNYRGKKTFTGKPGQLRYINGLVSGDTNGDKVADFEIAIHLIGSALTIQSFIL